MNVHFSSYELRPTIERCLRKGWRSRSSWEGGHSSWASASFLGAVYHLPITSSRRKRWVVSRVPAHPARCPVWPRRFCGRFVVKDPSSRAPNHRPTKACRPTAPKWDRSAKQKERVKRFRDARLFLSMWGWTLTATSNARHWAQPPRTDIKVDLLPHPAKQAFVRGSGARFPRAYSHTPRGCNVDFAICIGLAAQLLRMYPKATKHGVAVRMGLAAQILRIRSN